MGLDIRKIEVSNLLIIYHTIHYCVLPPALGSDMLWTLGAVNRLSLKKMRHLWGRGKDAIASSDITKAPFVQLQLMVGSVRFNRKPEDDLALFILLLSNIKPNHLVIVNT